MTTKTETIQKHAIALTNAWIAKDETEKKINDVIIEFIQPRKMTDQAIDDYLKYFSDAMIKSGKAEKTVGVYKSNVKRILKLAINHKEDVIKLGKTTGNLNQWYNACGESKTPERNKNPKVSAPKATEQPKLGAEDKQPSEARDPIADFTQSVKIMLETGMTAEQIHKMIDELATLVEKKAA